MKRSFTEKTWRSETTFQALCSAFLQCRTPEDIANFLRDIATLSEMKALSERLETARLLQERLPYREVSDRTGASTTTVSRVAWFLNNGERGYENVLKGTKHHHAPASARRGRHGT